MQNKKELVKKGDDSYILKIKSLPDTETEVDYRKATQNVEYSKSKLKDMYKNMNKEIDNLNNQLKQIKEQNKDLENKETDIDLEKVEELEKMLTFIKNREEKEKQEANKEAIEKRLQQLNEEKGMILGAIPELGRGNKK